MIGERAHSQGSRGSMSDMTSVLHQSQSEYKINYLNNKFNGEITKWTSG
jgi:hypothetical protein